MPWLALEKTLKLAEPENRVAPLYVKAQPWKDSSGWLKENPSNRNSSADCWQPSNPAANTNLEPGPAAEALIEPLSERELEILQHLNGPLSTPEIAEELVVSANTVRTHIKNIYGKLGVHGRSGAVRRARELRLLS